jgi:hypothetical protein
VTAVTTTKMKMFPNAWLRIAAFLGAFALAAGLHAQGITTSALSGFVADPQGKPVAGANVTVLHEPSGTRATAVSRANGQYDLSGLRVGGPYTVTISGGGLPEEVRKDVYLNLGEATPLNVTLGATAVVKMEAVNVAGERSTVFSAARIGTGSTFTNADVEQLPSIRRNVQDIAQLDSRVTVLNLSQDGEMSAQGQNYRFNSFLVDNVQTNDPYGLNSNGFTTLRSPVPFEALQAVSVELNPYDVRRAGFTGALINAVTKSGTNKFSGMLYGEYTDLNMRAKNPVPQANTNPPVNLREPFRERTFGGTFGGPIIRDRLFFFLSYDEFRRQTPAPSLSLALNPTQVSQIVARARSFNYEPGDLTGPQNVARQKTHIAKLDWNISNAHRLSVSYRRVRSLSPVFQFYGGTNTSFSNFWYDSSRKTDAYTAQLFSTWTPNFRTEATFSALKYDGTAQNRGTPFPQVFIQGLTAVRVADGVTVTNGTVDLGTYNVQQENEKTSKSRTATFTAEYLFGDHTFTAGADYQRAKTLDTFITNAYGSYTFATFASWIAGTPATKTQTVFAPGKTADDAIGSFTYTTLGFYAGDVWKPTSRLSVTAGLRFDGGYIPEGPTDIPTSASYSEASFRSAFGRSSTTTSDGNYTVSPRIGFNYRLDSQTKTQVRGGIGLFQGTNPAVWLNNAYQNRGVTANVQTLNATFSPDISAVGSAAPSTAVINLTNPDFHPPAVWKANLAIDHTLPFGGGLIVTAEADFLKTKYGTVIRNLNLKPVGTNPDGRIRYAGPIVASSTGNGRGSNSNSYSNTANYLNAGFADVYELGNTDKGGGNDITLKLTRPMKNNWSGSLAWTRSNFKEVSPMTATGVAQSFYNTRAVFNPNEDAASTSNYNIENRLVGQLTFRYNFIKRLRAPTTVTALWQSRIGRPYSWVFSGDANGDGFTFNDLFYVPSGPNDPRVRWNSATERDNFFAYVADSNLRNYMGRVVPRNSEASPWVQTLDLKVTQEIPIHGSVRAEVFANLLNVGNLLNDKWGLLQEIPFSYKRAVAGTTYDSATNQYIYTFTTASTSPTLDLVPTTTDGASANSRWQVQVGMRLHF